MHGNLITTKTAVIEIAQTASVVFETVCISDCTYVEVFKQVYILLQILKPVLNGENYSFKI